MEASHDLRAAAALARLLGDPTRLGVLQHLGRHGSSGVSEIALALDLAGPRLSNHLAKLRAEGVVKIERRGRHVVYEIADPAVLAVVWSLLSADVGRPGPRRPPRPSPRRHDGEQPTGPAAAFREARSCYDHLAGRLGVDVLRALQDRGALDAVPDEGEPIPLGRSAAEVFGRLGVDVAELSGRRRRLALACLDSTEGASHLGGAFGATLLSSLLDRGWLQGKDGGRVLRVTGAGRSGFARVLGISA
jgi:DNA-binding transcriptional ArsR family regulator